MTYGPGGPPSGPPGPPYGPPQGQAYGPPQGQPGYGQGAHGYVQAPQYGSPPQQYALPQHPAPSGKSRPSRRGRRRQAVPPGPYSPYGPPGPYTEAPPPRRRRRPETPTGGVVSDDDELWAVPAYVGMFVSGFIAPAIVLAVKGRTSNFARFHAVQALNLFVVIFTGTLIAFLLAYFKGPGWLPLVFAVLAADCFAVTKAAIGANRCEWYRLPAIVAWPIFR
jgi:uncharacterized membrane protein